MPSDAKPPMIPADEAARAWLATARCSHGNRSTTGCAQCIAALIEARERDLLAQVLLASTADAATALVERVRAEALQEAEKLALDQFTYWRDNGSIGGSGAAANILSAIAKLRARSEAGR